jgi:hypothetical protein
MFQPRPKTPHAKPRDATKEEKKEQAIAAREAYEAFPDLRGIHAHWQRTEGERRSLELVDRDGDLLARHRVFKGLIIVGEHVFKLTPRFRYPTREVIDLETGAPIFRTEGRHAYQKANMTIHFPDGRGYSLPVQGVSKGNAVMTALDETGSEVVKFRSVRVPRPRFGRWFPREKDEVVVLGDEKVLTRELICLIAVARIPLHTYVTVPSGGGG